MLGSTMASVPRASTLLPAAEPGLIGAALGPACPRGLVASQRLSTGSGGCGTCVTSCSGLGVPTWAARPHTQHFPSAALQLGTGSLGASSRFPFPKCPEGVPCQAGRLWCVQGVGEELGMTHVSEVFPSLCDQGLPDMV